MSHMTENQRMQFGRPDLQERRTGVQVRSMRPLIIYTVVACILLVVLGYATVQALDGWARFVVLGGIMTAIGGMIAVDPQRRT